MRPGQTPSAPTRIYHMSQKPYISIVIPVYNEELNIPPLF
jgi:cellulose synthase/poly-beta-1,6-N-acetylglucosamine synthase-like glycosyltransferase